MFYPNPYVTGIPGDSNFSFTAISNAKYYQRAIISLNGRQAAVFNGSGEGVPMTCGSGQTEYSGAVRGQTQVSVLFQFSKDGTNYTDAVVAEVLATPETVMIGTEDANDGDNNDTVLTLSISSL